MVLSLRKSKALPLGFFTCMTIACEISSVVRLCSRVVKAMIRLAHISKKKSTKRPSSRTAATAIIAQRAPLERPVVVIVDGGVGGIFGDTIGAGVAVTTGNSGTSGVTVGVGVGFGVGAGVGWEAGAVVGVGVGIISPPPPVTVLMAKLATMVWPEVTLVKV